ncbi:MAG: HEAT repeat domain-containing protein, partial [Candidatus Cyclobacteriaceae bacterium M3_2C_046]
KGNLNEIQSKFWGPKPVEELYDIKADPDNINNLADDPEYQEVLERMRQANREWIFEIRDAGFIPEPMLLEIARKMPPFNYVRKDDFPFEKIYETADMASADDPDFSSIIKRLNDSNPIIRYWAATGCIIHADEAGAAKETLITLQDDPETVVKIAAAEALYKMGEVNLALNMLEEALQSDNMMARTQAMNVLELMDPEDAVKALEAVKQIIPEQDSNEYDVRAAKTFVEKYAAL